MRVGVPPGRMEVNLRNTQFVDYRNAWEGMKIVPLLQVRDARGISVFGKTARVLINGAYIQLEGDALEAYLKTLDSGFIKSIEIDPNPGAGYEGQAYVNIILDSEAGNYRLRIETAHEPSDDFVNEPGFSYALNLSKFRLYASYDFEYNPFEPYGTVEKQIANEPSVIFETEHRYIFRNHQTALNLNFDLGDKDNLSLNNYYSYINQDGDGLTSGINLERKIRDFDKNHLLQFSQIWTHHFNDSIQLKLGFKQIFKNAVIKNLAWEENLSENQSIKTKIPIYVAFSDYKQGNKWGELEAGLRFQSISVTDDNKEIIGFQTYKYPYHYNEKVLAAYLGQSLDLGNEAQLSLGLRLENSLIDYGLETPNPDEAYHKKPRFTHLLYSAGYDWATTSGRQYNLTFRKSLQRPEYSALNPFQEIAKNITYFLGDTDLKPAQHYGLSFHTYKNDWALHGQTGYVKYYITDFYQIKNNKITRTYRNFENVYFVKAGISWGTDLFDGIWQTDNNLEANYYHLHDNNFNHRNSTPGFELTTSNHIELGKGWNFITDFFFISNSKDGLLKHFNYSKLDLALEKNFNRDFSITIYTEDILASDRRRDMTLVPGYFFDSNINMDTITFGASIRYVIRGKTYRAFSTETPEDDAIERLN